MEENEMAELQSALEAHQTEQQTNSSLSPEEEFEELFDNFDEASPAETLKVEEPPVQEAPLEQEVPQEENLVKTDDEDHDHRFKSMMGRLQKAQQENSQFKTQLSDMKAMVEDLQKQLASRNEPVESEPPLEGVEDLPEQVRTLVHEKSSDGERLRRVLEEYGPDHVNMLAQSVLAQRAAEEATAQMRQQFEMDAGARHKTALAEAHPEFADAILGKDAAKGAELQNGLNSWIRQLPYAEGAEMMRRLGSGSTYEVSDMLARYKKFRFGSSSPSTSMSGRTKKIASSNIAMPSSGMVSPAKGKATSFEDVWDELDRK